uniref:Uncharacterized protein n=1 Tax=Trichogramma kaykai TaxID=54128 RepID=A0ABD2VUU5_9HYME
MPHSGLRSTQEDNGVQGSTLLAGGHGSCLHTVLDEKQATRNIAAGVAATEKRASEPHLHEHVVDTNNNATVSEETFTVVKGRRGRHRDAHQAEEVERSSQLPRLRQRKIRLRSDATAE